MASDKVWLHFLNFGEVAGVAQLVEHFLAKEDVARSSRVTRSTFSLVRLKEGNEVGIVRLLLLTSVRSGLCSPNRFLRSI